MLYELRAHIIICILFLGLARFAIVYSCCFSQQTFTSCHAHMDRVLYGEKWRRHDSKLFFVLLYLKKTVSQTCKQQCKDFFFQPFSFTFLHLQSESSVMLCSISASILKVEQCLHKSQREIQNEITDYYVHTAHAHAWMSCIFCQYVPARIIRKNTKLIMAMNHKHECFCMSASSIVERASRKTHLNGAHGGNY